MAHSLLGGDKLNFSVSTESIHAQVTNIIRQAIVSGQLAMGEKLSEAALAQKLGVSRTPVREALKQLQREGLVEIIPRVGTCVTKPTEKEITELFALKEVLEGLAAGHMAQREKVPELQELIKAMEDMDEAAKNRNIDDYVEANDRFHDAIIRGSGNSKLLYHFNLLINQLPYRRFVYMTLDQPQRLEKSVEEHRRIVEAITSGDHQLAEKMMREHVKASGSKLMEFMKAELFRDNKSKTGR
ncbi:GntR family transcriptional regulator [Aeribacillus pallidus]|nr:GntR family transcriptional regulator [Aeribacillus pallidus]